MNRKALTLIELLISLVILSMVAVGFSSMDLFSSKQVTAANKILKTQNDAAYLTELIAKDALKAVGTINSHPARLFSSGGDSGIAFTLDINLNGKKDAAPDDRECAYVYRGAPDYEMRYYADYAAGSYTTVSNTAYMLPDFGPVYDPSYNYLTMEIATCWDPRNERTSEPCGSPSNPVARIRSRILMPAVSVR